MKPVVEVNKIDSIRIYPTPVYYRTYYKTARSADTMFVEEVT